MRVPAGGRAEDARVGTAAPGRAPPAERASAGTTKSSAPDERRYGVPGQPEDERAATGGERDRLAGAHRDAPEDLLRAEIRERAADEIVRADRHAAGGDEDVRLETARERGAVDGRIVRGGLAGRDARRPRNGTRPPASRRSTRRSRRRRAARRASGARCPWSTIGDPGSRTADRLGDARGCERRDARGRERRARLDDTGSPARTSPPRGRTFAPGSAAAGTCTAPSCSVTSSTGTTASAPSGTTPPVAIPIASPAPKRSRGGLPRGHVRDDRERPGRVGRAESEPVHRRAGEAGQVDGRPRVLGEHAPAASASATGSRRERPRAREDVRERVVDGDGIGHGADGTHGVRSGA